MLWGASDYYYDFDLSLPAHIDIIPSLEKTQDTNC